ncbi:MAG: ribosomal protein S18-alanine N-acetyltransferase [Candidatus Limivicinus sp.]
MNIPNILIEEGCKKYIAALEKLENQCFSLPWTKEQLESQMPDDRHIFLVAKLGDSVIGYAGMMYIIDEGYISNVAVDGAHRKSGIGSLLIEELLHRAEALNLRFVSLEVRETNEPAKALYGKYDFEPVGLRKNYYDSPKENAIIMTRFLK